MQATETILRMIADGSTNVQIARHFGVKLDVVAYKVATILQAMPEADAKKYRRHTKHTVPWTPEVGGMLQAMARVSDYALHVVLAQLVIMRALASRCTNGQVQLAIGLGGNYKRLCISGW